MSTKSLAELKDEAILDRKHVLEMKYKERLMGLLDEISGNKRQITSLLTAIENLDEKYLKEVEAL